MRKQHERMRAPPHAVANQLLVSDPKVVGTARIGKLMNVIGWIGVLLITVCVGSLAVSWINE